MLILYKYTKHNNKNWIMYANSYLYDLAFADLEKKEK